MGSAFPKQLFLPLVLSENETLARFGLLIPPGEKVKKGQQLTSRRGSARFSPVNLYAPTSGVFRGMSEHPWAYRFGSLGPCLIIEPDGQDDLGLLQPIPWQSIPRRDLYRRLAQLGLLPVVGEADYPAAIRDNNSKCTLIIRAIDYEVLFVSRDRLMSHSLAELAKEVVNGILILGYLFSATEIIMVVRGDKTPASVHLQIVAGATGIRIETVPVGYQQAENRFLAQKLTGLHIPFDRPLSGYGIEYFEVAKAAAVYRAVEYGEPITQQTVAIGGEMIRSNSYSVWLGAPISDLLLRAGLPGSQFSVFIGDQDSGFILPDLASPVTQEVSLLTVQKPKSGTAQPCTACGECSKTCPAELQPAKLYQLVKDNQIAQAREEGMMDCIGCGVCAKVCPSEIPLLNYFRFAQGEIRTRARRQMHASQLRARYDVHMARKERSAQKSRVANEVEKDLSQPTFPGSMAKTAPADFIAPATAVACEADKEKLIAAVMARAADRRAQNNGIRLANQSIEGTKTSDNS